METHTPSLPLELLGSVTHSLTLSVAHTALHTHTYFMKKYFFNPQKVRRLIIIFIYLSSIIIISPVEVKVCVSIYYSVAFFINSDRDASLPPNVNDEISPLFVSILYPDIGNICLVLRRGAVTSTKSPTTRCSAFLNCME